MNTFKLTNFPNLSLEFPPGDYGEEEGTHRASTPPSWFSGRVLVDCPLRLYQIQCPRKNGSGLMTRIKEKALQKIRRFLPVVTLEVNFQIVPNATPSESRQMRLHLPFPPLDWRKPFSLTGASHPNLLDIEFVPDRKLDFALPLPAPSDIQGNTIYWSVGKFRIQLLGWSAVWSDTKFVHPQRTPSFTRRVLISNEGANPRLTLRKSTVRRLMKSSGFRSLWADATPDQRDPGSFYRSL